MPGETVFQVGSGVLAIILMALIGFVWRQIASNGKAVSSLEDKFQDYKLKVATEYMSKGDTTARFDKIDNSLARIWEAIDDIRGHPRKQ